MGGLFAESDMDSLAELARKKGVPLKVLSAAREVNYNLAERMLDKISSIVESVQNKEVGILGLAFNPIPTQWRVPLHCNWHRTWLPKVRRSGPMIQSHFLTRACS